MELLSPNCKRVKCLEDVKIESNGREEVLDTINESDSDNDIDTDVDDEIEFKDGAISEHLVGSGNFTDKYIKIKKKYNGGRKSKDLKNSCNSTRRNAHTSMSKVRSTYECNICFKGFQRQKNLDLHMEMHLGTQKFACNVCDAMFSRKHDLIRHSTRHSGEKPYKCNLCDKRYRMPGDLGRHRNVIHGTGNVCDVCGKKYVRKFDLKQHKARHHKALQSSLSIDIRDEAADENTLQEEHTELQMEKRNQIHICPYCDKSFSTSNNRSKHVRRLHSNSSFTCDTCSKEFKAKYDLSFHVKTVHKFT